MFGPTLGHLLYDKRMGYFFLNNGTNIRSGPSTQCVALGQGQTSDYVQYDCYTEGDGYTWTHLFDGATYTEGWVRDDLLSGYGSNVHC